MSKYLDSMFLVLTDSFNWIWLGPLLIIGGLFILDYYDMLGWAELKQDIIDHDKKVEEVMSIVTATKDCKILQDNILWLISEGADAGSWMPNKTDRVIKIANQRYEILCKV